MKEYEQVPVDILPEPEAELYEVAQIDAQDVYAEGDK